VYVVKEGVAGAIGNVGQLAGNPFSSSFVIPQQSRMEADRLFRQGMDNTESGRKCKRREHAKGFRQMQFLQAMGIPDMMQMGNMASMGNIGNAGFFMGPQMGQGIPPGYMNKIVS
jgi:hypothetical protein